MAGLAATPSVQIEHPFAKLSNQLWEKILDEEVITTGPCVEQHTAEAREAVQRTFELVTKGLEDDDNPDRFIQEISRKLQAILDRPKPEFYSPRIVNYDLFYLRADIESRTKALKGVGAFCEQAGPLTKGIEVKFPDGKSFVIQEIGEVAFSTYSVYRLYGEIIDSDGTSAEGKTYAFKTCSSGDVRDWERLKQIGLPVFDTGMGVAGGFLMDDLDENGQRVTVTMNCHRGVSWYFLQNHKIKEFTNFDDDWLSAFFEGPILAGRAGRFIPGIAYFFNCGKKPSTDLKVIVGDYGELESFRNKRIPLGSKRSLSAHNCSDARDALKCFLEFALESPQECVRKLDQYFFKIRGEL